MSEFIKEVDVASTALKVHTNNCISVAAGCELFTRYVTRTANDSTEVTKHTHTLRQAVMV